jgi:glycerol-3-phosphate acyltransferase PlsY
MMTDIGLITIGLVFLAYLWGSIPTAVLVCHALNIPDPRKKGSGNPGTTNVLRIGSRKGALFTLVGDAGKGILALLPCSLLQLSSTEQSFCALAAIIGHLFPLFSSFRGGKGIATTFGVCVSLFWPITVLQSCIWCLVFAVSRTASLASIATVLITPIIVGLTEPTYLPAILIISALLLLSHRVNISNLLQGKEPRF